MEKLQIKLAIHHVFLQLLITNDYKLVFNVLSDLKNLKVKKLGINTKVLLSKALFDRFSGKYKTLIEHKDLFDTSESINQMNNLLKNIS